MVQQAMLASRWQWSAKPAVTSRHSAAKAHLSRTSPTFSAPHLKKAVA
jgi:hypothetical protein